MIKLIALNFLLRFRLPNVVFYRLAVHCRLHHLTNKPIQAVVTCFSNYVHVHYDAPLFGQVLDGVHERIVPQHCLSRFPRLFLSVNAKKAVVRVFWHRLLKSIQIDKNTSNSIVNLKRSNLHILLPLSCLGFYVGITKPTNSDFLL
jgi:hypothetical protein